MQDNRKIGLDIVRSIAILSVVVLHLVIPYGIFFKKNVAWIPIPDGVDIFFVLSGFLIGGIVLKTFEDNKTSNKTIVEFWIMRWFRTLPNYYLFSLIVFVLNGFHLPLKNLFFLQNLYKAYPNPFPETWSLCVEEWFYLLFPIGVYFLSNTITKKKYYAVLIATIAMLLVSVFIRVHWYYFKYPEHTIQNFLITRSLVITRLDAIAVGILGAFVKYYHYNLWKKNTIYTFLIGLIFFIFLTVHKTIENPATANFDFYSWNIDFLVYSISIILMFPFLENINIKNKLLNNFFTNTSLISYSMYLLHNTILFKIMGMLFLYFNYTNYFMFVIVYMIVLYFLCNIIYKYFEKRFINYRILFINKYLRSN
jgi:peptidoglycan/LPS O-acetylase OafA/YrhL